MRWRWWLFKTMIHRQMCKGRSSYKLWWCCKDVMMMRTMIFFYWSMTTMIMMRLTLWHIQRNSPQLWWWYDRLSSAKTSLNITTIIGNICSFICFICVMCISICICICIYICICICIYIFICISICICIYSSGGVEKRLSSDVKLSCEKQEHKVSYRCSLPSPLQKRSEN